MYYLGANLHFCHEKAKEIELFIGNMVKLFR